jgi:hypothetical protein
MAFLMYYGLIFDIPVLTSQFYDFEALIHEPSLGLGPECDPDILMSDDAALLWSDYT